MQYEVKSLKDTLFDDRLDMKRLLITQQTKLATHALNFDNQKKKENIMNGCCKHAELHVSEK